MEFNSGGDGGFFLQVFYFDIGENRRGRFLKGSLGVYLSEKDPILMPSQDSRLSVGTIRCEAGSKVAAVEQIQETPLVIKSTSSGSEQRKVGPSELLGVGKNVVSESSSRPGSSSHIAPVIHEWIYDAMCHDLLEMEGNKYVHVVPSKTGDGYERKEVLLEDHDLVWLELRHSHIADLLINDAWQRWWGDVYS
ncbi:unnamed protein product [Lactuca saligna]|uniref:Uncharacterized protein n=2 Tax=Lactuca saligna TaxID=75948 RepID=A0AA36E9V3_LACSI|nr:unnamed protein product [Lactuca saligna]